MYNKKIVLPQYIKNKYDCIIQPVFNIKYCYLFYIINNIIHKRRFEK